MPVPNGGTSFVDNSCNLCRLRIATASKTAHFAVAAKPFPGASDQPHARRSRAANGMQLPVSRRSAPQILNSSIASRSRYARRCVGPMIGVASTGGRDARSRATSMSRNGNEQLADRIIKPSNRDNTARPGKPTVSCVDAKRAAIDPPAQAARVQIADTTAKQIAKWGNAAGVVLGLAALLRSPSDPGDR